MSNIISLSEVRKRSLQEAANPIIKALDTLALALTYHGHVWTDEEVSLYDTAVSYIAGDPAGRKYTLSEAVAYLAAEWLHVCDVEAQEIANRISGPRGMPNRCPDGVQVLEDAEAIFRAAVRRATLQENPND